MRRLTAMLLVGGVGMALISGAMSVSVRDSCGMTTSAVKAADVAEATVAPLDTLWVRQYNGQESYTDIAFDIATDASGNAVVTGYSNVLGPYTDFLTIKYDPQGHILWSRAFDGLGGNQDYATAAAVGPSGRVYVTGTSFSGFTTQIDWQTVAYSPTGDSLWSRSFHGTILWGNDQPRQIVADADGSVTVCGRIYNLYQSIGNYDLATVRYDSAGTVLWQFVYDSPAPTRGQDDEPFDLVSSPTGDVYVVGRSNQGMTRYDMLVIRISAYGDSAWTRKLNGPGNFDDLGRAICLDLQQNVIVGGETYDPNNNYRDFLLAKWDSSGSVIWQRTYDGLSGGDDFIVDVGVDASGHVYAIGQSRGPGAEDIVVIKYDPQGQVQWLRRYNGSGNSSDLPREALVTPDGHIYVCGTSMVSGGYSQWVILKYDSAGSVEKEATFSSASPIYDDCVGLALASPTRLYATGFSSTPTNSYDYTTIAYSDCACPCHGDPQCDSISNVQDVVQTVNVAFRGASPVFDAQCPHERTDVNCDGFSTVQDVVKTVNVAFRGANPATEFCEPCGM